MTTRAIGDVRPSQLVTTFGPGAIVDLQTLSVIVAGIDEWPTDERLAINEPRLQRALRVKRFFAAKPTEGGMFSRTGTVPTYLFPRFQVCPACQTLSAVGEGLVQYEERWQELTCRFPSCKGRGKFRATTLPAPFVVACASGHLGEFPWREYVHRSKSPCDQPLKLYSIAETGTVSDIFIECACAAKRSAGEAFGEHRSEVLGPCLRTRPWLGRNDRDPEACTNENAVRAMQRGATNGWFPVVRSALAVREAATPIGMAINSCNQQQIQRIETQETLGNLLAMGMFPALEPFSLADLWSEIQKQRGESATDEVDLRWPEWVVFRDPNPSPRDSDELFLEAGVVPPAFRGLVTKVVLARKLLEVRALVGFTRLDPMGIGTDEAFAAPVAPISRKERDWLPAIEVRGEGLFIELDSGAVARWEERPAVHARMRAMAQKYAQWQAERGTKPPSPFPGAGYVLLHSLAHVLMRQLCLDCGYSASSVRERIYSSSAQSRGMAGLLIYTATPDSEGSLGGLVDLGRGQRFPELVLSALRGAARCSSDPLCADHDPDAHATINGAACHACLLASESSCETFNRFLDRNVLVPTMADSSMAFFEGVGL